MEINEQQFEARCGSCQLYMYRIANVGNFVSATMYKNI